MSWLFSRALVAEYSVASCSGGELSALLSANPTPQAFLPSDRMTVFSRPSRFGMTFAPSTDGLGAALLTWFLGAFRARTFQPPAKAQESTGSAPACGDRWRELSVRYDRDSCSWRTHRSLWDEDLSACSLTLPKWGSMRDGVLSELLTLERPTAENDAGLLPTPLESNTKAHHMRSGGRPARSYWPTPIATEWKNGCGKTGNRAPEKAAKAGLKLGEAVKLWPTPTSTLGTNGGKVTPAKSREGGTLIEALSNRTQWATPTVCGNYNRAGASAKSGDGLATQAGGSLNPTWVEWLMGWPLGWTDLKPLATDKCRNVRLRHGGF